MSREKGSLHVKLHDMIHSRPPEDVPIRLLATHLSQLVHSSVLTSIKNLTDSDSGILSDENNRSEWSDVDNPSVTDLTPPHTITDYRLSLAPTSGLLVLVIGAMLSFSTPFEFHAGYLNVLSPGWVGGGGSCEDGPAEGILSAHSDWCHRQENQSAGTCPTQHTANTPSQRNTTKITVFPSQLYPPTTVATVMSILCIISFLHF